MNWQPGKYFHLLTEGQSMENLYADICAWLGLGLGLSQLIPQQTSRITVIIMIMVPCFLGERTTRCLLRCGEIVFLVAMIDLPPVLPVPTQHFRFHCLRKQWSVSLKQERNISSSLPCPCSSRRGYDYNNNKNRNDSNTYSAVRNNCRCKQIKLTQQITFKLFTCEVGSSTNVSEATIWMLSFSSSFRKWAVIYDQN